MHDSVGPDRLRSCTLRVQTEDPQNCAGLQVTISSLPVRDMQAGGTTFRSTAGRCRLAPRLGTTTARIGAAAARHRNYMTAVVIGPGPVSVGALGTTTATAKPCATRIERACPVASTDAEVRPNGHSARDCAPCPKMAEQFQAWNVTVMLAVHTLSLRRHPYVPITPAQKVQMQQIHSNVRGYAVELPTTASVHQDCLRLTFSLV